MAVVTLQPLLNSFACLNTQGESEKKQPVNATGPHVSTHMSTVRRGEGGGGGGYFLFGEVEMVGVVFSPLPTNLHHTPLTPFRCGCFSSLDHPCRFE